MGGVAQTEQDSFEDIANCVEAICRTPYGFRLDNPDFGFPSIELLSQPVLSEDVIETVQNQEPRASILMTEAPGLLDQLIDNITVEISA